jgi:solute carrier family 25 (mitochondrial thiamine pyrophosphate transporter), member 19
LSGAIAGATGTTVTYPLDLLRTRFAATGPRKVYPSFIYAIREIYTSEGPKGYFRGLSAGLLQIAPYMGLFFSCYEALRPRIHPALSHLPLLRDQGLETRISDGAIAGICSSVIAKTGIFPLDLVRKRLQVQGPTRGRYVHTNIPVYEGIFGTLKAILKKEGFKGLYRGLAVSLWKAAPASAVTMATYEMVLKTLKDVEGPLTGT